MAQLIEPDLCVIGAGSAGLSVAAAAAAFGVPVVLVEKARMGGDCLNTGCVPSKALIAAAKRAFEVQRCAAFGIVVEPPAVEFARVRDHVHQVIAAIAPNDSRERFTGLGVRVLAGHARFRDRRTVTVDGEHTIRARRFVIATGSRPVVPPIPGLAATPYLTNETIFDLAECPRHLVVIGAGPVGLELAQAYRRLGAAVTVLEKATPLVRDDPECAAVVLDQLAREGIVLRTRVEIVRIEPTGQGVRALVKTGAGEEEIAGSHLLVAAGRRPDVDGLDLEAAGIKYDEGGIAVDRGLKTTNRRVYAIGDVVGGPQFTHVASHHAGVVIKRALFRWPAKVSKTAIPWVTFTDPELAQVGLTEEEARGWHGDIRVLRAAYHDNDRARTERQSVGHIKVITTRNGRILGATIVGAHAGELIAAWSLAVKRGLKIAAFADMIVPYPTLAEIGKRAAIEFFRPSAARPWVRRITTLLRRFG
jgi:pyruvate/2-oxoglutarate dehydrogenase complex dihydrolipoamide dehydrogenase (E3) component